MVAWTWAIMVEMVRVDALRKYLEGKVIRLADGLQMECEGNRGIKHDSWVQSLSGQMMLFVEMRSSRRATDLRETHECCFEHVILKFLLEVKIISSSKCIYILHI